MTIVLVCGDRNWTDAAIIEQRLRRLPAGTVIIHGANGRLTKRGWRGADMIADTVARRLGFAVQSFPAEWAQFGDAAGPIRNRAMLDANPTRVIAFHAHLAFSRGTKDCVEEARRRGIPVEVIAGRRRG